MSNKALPLNPLSVSLISVPQLFQMTAKCIVLKQERKEVGRVGVSLMRRHILSLL